MPRHPRSRRPARTIALLLLFVAPLLLSTDRLSAQTPSLPPMKGMFGVGDDEFFKGAWMKIRPDTAGAPDSTLWTKAGQFWEVAERLGVDILRVQGRDFIDLGMTDSMIAQRTDKRRQRMIVANIGENFEKASTGREVRFFPFTGRDSAEYPFWRARFMTIAGGVTAANAIEKDVHGEPALEQHYRRSTTPAGTIVARDIEFGGFAARRYRWPRFRSNGDEIRDDSVQNSEEFLIDLWQFDRTATSQFVVVTGRLLEAMSSTRMDEPVLRIDVLYEIPAKRKFVTFDPSTGSTSVEIATGNIERTIATLLLTKRDLSPAPGRPISAYREIALGFDARWSIDSTGRLRNTGPLFPGNESRRMNLKVTWIGNEDLAIHSIALRDSIGQIVLGTTAADSASRAALFAGALHEVRQMLTLDGRAGTEPIWPIIALAPRIESYPIHSRAFNRLTRVVHDSVLSYDVINNRRDSMAVWNETDYNEPLFQRSNVDANPGLLVPDAVVPETGIKTFEWLADRLKLRHGRIPSIAAHNGGRFLTPLLGIERDDIEYGYESTLQLLGFRQNIPWLLDQEIEERMIMAIARAAVVSRDTRRRLIVVPFSVARMHINFNERTDRPERDFHSIAHIPEPAELRTMMNLGLCYGARGVLWQIAEGHYNFIQPGDVARDDRGTYHHGVYDDFGVHSPLARGPNLDVFPAFSFYQSRGLTGYAATEVEATIPNFFTGWAMRTKALSDLHRWIGQVGPHLMKLDWREGYSMHFTVHQPYDTDYRIPFRPIAGGELVRSVRSRRPDEQVYDSPARTFVELGMFYRTNATSDPLKDTNHIFLVNRRCFERSALYGPASDTGRRMEMLAEARTIEVRLNLLHPAGASRRVRIEEVAPDTARLPMANTWRRGLDTIVHVDSTFAITLGPGRAALLRITYAPTGGSSIYDALEEIGTRDWSLETFGNVEKIEASVRERNGVYDSIPVWNETDYNESLFQRWKQSANPELLVPNAVVLETSIKTFLWLAARLQLRDGRISSIRAHN